MDNKKLNSLVVSYQNDHTDEKFEEIYEIVSKTWKGFASIARSLRSDIHEVTALYEDVLLRCIEKYNGATDFINFYRYSLTRARTDLYLKKKRQYEVEIFECELTSDDNTFEFVINSNNTQDNTAATVLETKEADQRHLISFLVSGADATTTAIVEAFLNEKKPTPTAIGKKLGLHHSTVLRKLTRLASKYDSKKFGDYRDFLVARS